MRVNCSLLCNGANTTGDGLLNIVGGGITILTTTDFPFALVNLVLALSLTASTDELFTGDHTLTFSFLKRPNAQQASHGTVEFSAATPPEPSQPIATAPLVIPLNQVVIPEPGEYDIPIDLDNTRLADLFLNARQGE